MQISIIFPFRWGIVGVVEQFILGKVEILQYLNEVEKISAHVGRLCPNIQDNTLDATLSQSFVNGSSTARASLRIDCEKEYPFLPNRYRSNYYFPYSIP